MERKRNKMFIIIGVIIGLVLSVVLCFTQNIESMLYLSGAPLYIDTLILGSDGLVNITTFVYFVVIFSFVGFIFSAGFAKKFKLLIVIVLVIVHLVLAYLGARTIFDGLPGAIGNAFSTEESKR